MKAKHVILCVFGMMIALGLFLYHNHWNSKPVRIKRMTEEYYQREIAQLQSASPRRAAAAAATHGNLKFYMVQGENYSRIPGITNGHSLKWIYEREQYRVIFFVTDVIKRPQSEYQRVAWQYAASYNLALEKLILTNSPPIPSNP